MAGDAILSPSSTSRDAASTRTTFTLPTTALFHKDNFPAVWVVGASNSTLELRQVAVSSYTDHSVVVTGSLRDGDTVVVAGVHTVYAGERVSPVRPLFDGEGEVAGPASSDSTAGTYASATPTVDSRLGSRK
jgi:hypothetical protein